jgi:hypothetical protein
MKKQKLTPQQKEIIRQEDPNPLDGSKAVGCLLVGIALLVLIGILLSNLIHSIR